MHEGCNERRSNKETLRCWEHRKSGSADIFYYVPLSFGLLMDWILSCCLCFSASVEQTWLDVAFVCALFRLNNVTRATRKPRATRKLSQYATSHWPVRMIHYDAPAWPLWLTDRSHFILMCQYGWHEMWPVFLYFLFSFFLLHLLDILLHLLPPGLNKLMHVQYGYIVDSY